MLEVNIWISSSQQDNTENHDYVMVSCMLCLCLRFNFVYNYYVTFLGENHIFMRMIGFFMRNRHIFQELKNNGWGKKHNLSGPNEVGGPEKQS